MTNFSHIAGDPALDLVNTVDWRLSETDRGDRLASYASVLAWCLDSGLLTAEEYDALTAAAAGDPQAAEREREAVIDLREDAYLALFDDDMEAAQRVAQAHRDGLTGASLRRDGHSWRWCDDEVGLFTPGHRIARALLDLFRRNDLDKLHQCEDAECGWVYLDTSPRRNRRWCVSSDCGDRNRARAYYARKTQKR